MQHFTIIAIYPTFGLTYSDIILYFMMTALLQINYAQNFSNEILYTCSLFQNSLVILEQETVPYVGSTWMHAYLGARETKRSLSDLSVILF